MSAAKKAYNIRKHSSDEFLLVGDKALQQTKTLPIMDAYGRKSTAAAEARRGKLWTSREYADRFEVSRSTARKDLNQLVDMGVLEPKGERRKRHYVLAGETVDT